MKFEELIIKLDYLSEEDLILIKKSYDMASVAHSHQLRDSGEPFITHPLAVASILADWKADRNTICAAILHDIVEDTNVTLKEIENLFGETVASLVDGVTKLTSMNFSSKLDNKNANMRKIITSFRKDVRIILIKLADRLHNMRTLEYKDPKKRKIKALETMDLYVPLAYFIGAYNVKSELEDKSFKFLMPEIYQDTFILRKNVLTNADLAIEEMSHEIRTMLIDNGISNDIKLHIKNIYGVHKRILEKEDKNNIHDLISFQVIVNEVMDCYLSLGYIHHLYRPICEEFKDYISSPKTNMYSSLNTTVFGLDSTIMQSHIRTRKMHLIDTLGIGAYWQLKGKGSEEMMQVDIQNKYQFYKSLTEIDEAYFNNQEFIDQVNRELLGKKIYVYDSKGNSIELPVGSTIIDFIYKTCPDNAQNVKEASVNENVVPYDYVLNNSDRVNLTLNRNVTYLDSSWLENAHITLAKRKILETLNNK